MVPLSGTIHQTLRDWHSDKESRELTILIDRCRSPLRLSAVRQSLKREEEHSQERVRTISQPIALLGMLFFAFLHSRKRVGEVDFLRLRDLFPLSIRPIREIRGLADPDRLPYETCFHRLVGIQLSSQFVALHSFAAPSNSPLSLFPSVVLRSQPWASSSSLITLRFLLLNSPWFSVLLRGPL